MMKKKIFSSILVITIISCLFSTNVMHAFASSYTNNNLEQKVKYFMDGTDIIEIVTFNDIDGFAVKITSTIHKNGSGKVSIYKNGETQYINMENYDYDLFFKLANIKNTSFDNMISAQGSDIIGSQFYHVYLGTTSYEVTNTEVDQIRAAGVSAAVSILISAFSLPGGIAVTIGSTIYSIILAKSPYRVDIIQDAYEVHFTYDDVYYTHCYHQWVKAFDTGNHLIDSYVDYYQAIGG